MPQETHVHLHIDVTSNQQPIIDQLIIMEDKMSELHDAVAGLTASIDGVVARVDQDVAHLHDLLNQALAADVADQATIAALQADAAATVESITTATASLTAIDPDADFPVAEPAPADGGTPTDPGTGTPADGGAPADEPTV